MLNQLRRNSGVFLRLAEILLFMAVFSFWASFPALAEEVAPDPKTAPCKGLKPYNNLDELLYQFYINLDSDCLFTMPVEELEKAWDTKIYYIQTKIPHQTKAMRDEFLAQYYSSDFFGKPYKSEKDTFYIEIIKSDPTKNNSFHLAITKDYQEKHGTLFPDGNFPKLLPPSYKT